MRGRKPTTGLDAALKIAKARGGIMRFCEDTDRVADFLIRSPGRIVFVRAMRVSRLRCTPEDLNAECQQTIRTIRTLPGEGPVIRELWLYSRHGCRFFRIGDETIERIDKDGNSAEDRRKILQATSGTATPETAVMPVHTTDPDTPSEIPGLQDG